MVNARKCPALPFTKMHGAGNDFIVLDLRRRLAPSPNLCRVLADRHKGVGCDLILGVEPPRSAIAVASFRIWTADGSSSQQCGNGIRCIAAWVRRAGMASGSNFALDSPCNTHLVEALPGNTFRVRMGIPEFEHGKMALTGFQNERNPFDIDLGGGLRFSVSVVSIGNPHAVIEVNDVRTAPVVDGGRAIQNSPLFPSSVNVGFAEVISREHIRLRVYEYGAGETSACGSGACAAAVILMKRGRIDRSVLVTLRGGDLRIDWPDPVAQVTMTGPAAFVFEGVLLGGPNQLDFPQNSANAE
jgi:diaminopimelate epimerase